MGLSSTSIRKRTPSYSEGADPLARPKPMKALKTPEPMSSADNQKDFDKIQEWWSQARESQSFVRLEMDVDDSFYHGDQFTQEDRQALEDVGQAPLVFNKIAPVCNWLIGTERRTRVDFNVLPRKKGLEDQAKMKKDVLKYISDTSKIPFAKSAAFKEAVISGLGWIETGVRANETENPVFARFETWRNMWYDPLGTATDASDWRYQFRSKWTDLDIAQAMFPSFANALQSCATSVNIDLTTKDDDEFYIGQRFSRRDSSGAYIGVPNYTEQINTQVNNRRERVRLVECWYRTPVSSMRVKGGRHHGRVVNIANQRMMWELNKELADGAASTYDAVVMRVRCAVFCENVLLQNMDSPYHHNRLPFVPLFAYRKGKFHEPYGVTRNARDPQEDLNKRYSKALFLLSSTRIIADKNAVQDWESLRTEVGRPDAQLLLDKAGARFEINKEAPLVEEHVKLMHNDGIHIMEGAGVTAENMGRDSNSLSGKAVLAKQNQGSVVTAELFDNLKFMDQLLGEILLSLAEQFMDQEMAVRITGEKGAVSFRDINTKGPDGTVTDDITATQMDYIVTEQDFRDTMRQAMFEQLTDMVSKMAPEIALNLLDVIVDMTDFPGKQALIDRIRKVNGQMPPVAEMTDEQKQEAKATQDKMQKAEEQKQKAIELELAEKQAKVAKTMAEADKLKAEIPGMGLESKLRAEMEKSVADIQRKAEDESRALADQLAATKQEAANRRYEIDKKAETDRAIAAEKRAADEANARTAADATARVAQITADASAAEAARTATSQDQLAALKSQVEHHKGERDRAGKEAADKLAAKDKEHKDRTEAESKSRAEADKKIADADKKTKDEAAAKDKKADGDKDEPAAPPPINVVVNVDTGGDQETTLKKNADGTITMSKKSTKKKEAAK